MGLKTGRKRIGARHYLVAAQRQELPRNYYELPHAPWNTTNQRIRLARYYELPQMPFGKNDACTNSRPLVKGVAGPGSRIARTEAPGNRPSRGIKARGCQTPLYGNV